jgi:hypothetical protein
VRSASASKTNEHTIIYLHQYTKSNVKSNYLLSVLHQVRQHEYKIGPNVSQNHVKPAGSISGSPHHRTLDYRISIDPGQWKKSEYSTAATHQTSTEQ